MKISKLYQLNNIVEFIYDILTIINMIYSVYNANIFGLIVIFYLREVTKIIIRKRIIIKTGKSIYLKLISVTFWCVFLTTLYMNKI
jgi:hypothetical protein